MGGHSDFGRRITRRRSLEFLLGGIGVAAARPACAAEALEQRSVEIGGVRDPQIGTQLLIADKTGLFKAQGLAVTVHWTESGTDIMSFLSSRAMYLATSSVSSQVILASKNVPIKTVAGLCDGAATQGLVLGPGVRVTGPADLVGKRFASPITSSHVMMLAKLGRQYGFDWSQVRRVNMEPTEAVTATMRGDVDGALTYDPFMSRLVQLGCTLYVTGTSSYITGEKIDLSREEQLVYQNGVFVSDQTWMEKNPQTMKAVLRALIAANDIILNDRSRAVGLMREFLRIDPTMMTSIMNTNRYNIALDDQIMRSITFASDWLQTVKRIQAPVSPASVLAPRLLQEIDRSLVNLKV
jgi:ABC-type nitrate/sulfonate/bicarbonate transport system substrate-binding protein